MVSSGKQLDKSNFIKLVKIDTFLSIIESEYKKTLQYHIDNGLSVTLPYNESKNSIISILFDKTKKSYSHDFYISTQKSPKDKNINNNNVLLSEGDEKKKKSPSNVKSKNESINLKDKFVRYFNDTPEGYSNFMTTPQYNYLKTLNHSNSISNSQDFSLHEPHKHAQFCNLCNEKFEFYYPHVSSSQHNLKLLNHKATFESLSNKFDNIRKTIGKDLAVQRDNNSNSVTFNNNSNISYNDNPVQMQNTSKRKNSVTSKISKASKKSKSKKVKNNLVISIQLSEFNKDFTGNDFKLSSKINESLNQNYSNNIVIKREESTNINKTPENIANCSLTKSTKENSLSIKKVQKTSPSKLDFISTFKKEKLANSFVDTVNNKETVIEIRNTSNKIYNDLTYLDSHMIIDLNLDVPKQKNVILNVFKNHKKTNSLLKKKRTGLKCNSNKKDKVEDQSNTNKYFSKINDTETVISEKSKSSISKKSHESFITASFNRNVTNANEIETIKDSTNIQILKNLPSTILVKNKLNKDFFIYIHCDDSENIIANAKFIKINVGNFSNDKNKKHENELTKKIRKKTTNGLNKLSSKEIKEGQIHLDFSDDQIQKLLESINNNKYLKQKNRKYTRKNKELGLFENDEVVNNFNKMYENSWFKSDMVNFSMKK